MKKNLKIFYIFLPLHSQCSGKCDVWRVIQRGMAIKNIEIMEGVTFSVSQPVKNSFHPIRKLDIDHMIQIEGGSRCENVAMNILGFGTVLAFSAIPLTAAVGIVSVGVGLLAAYGCAWK